MQQQVPSEVFEKLDQLLRYINSCAAQLIVFLISACQIRSHGTLD